MGAWVLSRERRHLSGVVGTKKRGGAWESGGREKRPMSSQGMNPIKQVWGWFIVERKPADSEIFPPLVGFP